MSVSILSSKQVSLRLSILLPNSIFLVHNLSEFTLKAKGLLQVSFIYVHILIDEG